MDEVPLLVIPPKFQFPCLLLFASNLEYSRIHIYLSVLTLFQGLKVINRRFILILRFAPASKSRICPENIS